MTDKDWGLILSFLAGFAIHTFVKNKVTIRFTYEDVDMESNPNFAEEMIFNCPVCEMPAEVRSILTEMQDGSDYTNYYVLDCLGEHETAAVTEQWYKENVLDRR